MSTMNTSRTSTQRSQANTKDAATNIGNSIASVAAMAAVALAVLGLLVGFDIFNTELSFQNGLTWLISGIVVATVANVFRREHHVTDSVQSHKSQDAETALGNSIAGLMAAAAVGLAVLGLLVAFDVISTNNPFENGLLWLASGVIVAMNANVFRREHHIEEPVAVTYETRSQTPTQTRDTRGV